MKSKRFLISFIIKYIEKVLEEMWNPKWREVIKFLAGLKGEEIIEKIYPGPEKDNVIYSRLFLAAECCLEVKEIRKTLRERIINQLRELIDAIKD
jgi:hypothetical protein